MEPRPFLAQEIYKGIKIMLKFIGNFLWFILIGLWIALINVFLGLLLCVTVVFLPFGIAMVKLASVYVLPFGVKYKRNFKSRAFSNIIYDIIGWINALIFLILGTVFFVTIIGIPFGKKCYSLSLTSLCPYGLDIIY